MVQPLRLLASQPYFARTLPDGRRQVSWRTWLLVWLVPGTFALAALGLVAEAAVKLHATVPATGTVVRVYDWPSTAPWNRGTPEYAPVFRYVWSDETETEASVGMRHPDWNFAIGSEHPILYFPGAKRDLVLPGPHNWAVAKAIGAIAAVTAVPALLGHRRLRRWQRGGR